MMDEVYYSELWADVFDCDTGEVLDLDWFRRGDEARESTTSVESLDISTITSESQLRQYSDALYGRWYPIKSVLDIEGMVCKWDLSISELKVIAFLTTHQRVCHHSYCTLPVCDVWTRIGLSRTRYYSALKSLEDKWVIKYPPCKIEEGEKIIEVYPYFVWRGWDKRRQDLLTEWFECDYTL